MTPSLIIALILFTLGQMGTLGIAVLYFRAETNANRREIETLRSEASNARDSDKPYHQLQLDTITNGLARVESSVRDIARAMNVNRRATDSTLIATPE